MKCFFSAKSFWLTINGNNGFVGDLMSETVIVDFLKINQTVSYYLLIFFILLFFLLSSNFKISHILSSVAMIKKLFSSKKDNLIYQENAFK